MTGGHLQENSDSSGSKKKKKETEEAVRRSGAGAMDGRTEHNARGGAGAAGMQTGCRKQCEEKDEQRKGGWARGVDNGKAEAKQRATVNMGEKNKQCPCEYGKRCTHEQ